MIKLLPYLKNRALGLHPQTSDPLIQGINALEQQLLFACQSIDRRAALRVFCRNHSYEHLADEYGYCLIEYILPAPLVVGFGWSTEPWLKIAAGILGDPWDTLSEVYVNIEGIANHILSLSLPSLSARPSSHSGSLPFYYFVLLPSHSFGTKYIQCEIMFLEHITRLIAEQTHTIFTSIFTSVFYNGTHNAQRRHSLAQLGLLGIS